MSRRRRAVLLLALATALGALAGTDVARREAALREGLGPAVRVLVAATDLEPGAPLTPDVLARRTLPARFAPAGAFTDPSEVAGLRTAAAIPRGGDVTTATIEAADDDGGALGLRPGERAARVVASAPAEAVVPGATVDVLAVGDGPATTRLLLRGAEVLAAEPAVAEDGDRLAVTLRTTLEQAVALAGEAAAAQEVRLLPRPSDGRPPGR